MATQYVNVPGFGSMVVEDTDTFTYVNIPGFGSFTNYNEAVASSTMPLLQDQNLGSSLWNGTIK